MLLGAAIGFGISLAVDCIDDGRAFNGSVNAGWYIGATLAGATIGAAAGMTTSYYATGSATSSVRNVLSGLFGKTTFYRSMTADDLATLNSTGKVAPGSETFISPSANYASKYNGITVEFTVRNRTVNWLTKIGVRDTSKLVFGIYPDMNIVSKGWMSTSAYFKAEQGIINIGLGYGKALNIFNKGILSFFII